MVMHYIDSKDHKLELKSSRNYLIKCIYKVHIIPLVTYVFMASGEHIYARIAYVHITYPRESNFKKPTACRHVPGLKSQLVFM